MRPVNKGKTPSIKFKTYQDAVPFLEKRIGLYCSFCELPIIHVPELEHKEAKSKGGEELSWDNFLFSCKYCNTRKGVQVKKGDIDKYLWPDTDDTFHAFLYTNILPEVSADYLQSKMDGSYERALNLYHLVKLNHRPDKHAKDRRFFARNEARNYAEKSRTGWLKIKNPEDKEIYLENILMTAKASGFFSVWMMVFADIEPVRHKLLDCFTGTRKEFCRPPSV